jgi:hypothetical protein
MLIRGYLLYFTAGGVWGEIAVSDFLVAAAPHLSMFRQSKGGSVAAGSIGRDFSTEEIFRSGAGQPVHRSQRYRAHRCELQARGRLTSLGS